jgi:hypothetical protein
LPYQQILLNEFEALIKEGKQFNLFLLLVQLKKILIIIIMQVAVIKNLNYLV